MGEESVHERLASLAGLGPDWDTYGALPITATAIDAASRVLDAVRTEHGEPWWVGPIPDGGVALIWRGEAAELEVWIDPNGMDATHLLTVGDVDGEIARIEEAPVSLDAVGDLISRLRRVGV